MPDPIIAGCSPRPPVAISPMPAVNSRGELQLFGCVSQSSRPARQTAAQARSEISKRCQQLGLSNATTGALLKSVKLNGYGNTAAGPAAQAARQMLASLESAVARNPRLSTRHRNQYAALWVTLSKRTGAKEVWTQLGQRPHFWGRMTARNRRVAASQLAKSPLAPTMVARGIDRVARHHLFASANYVGKYNAIADLCDTNKLLNVNTLPDAATRKKQAASLMKKHLGHMKPASRHILHRQVLAKANLMQKAFFEFKPGSKSNLVWGDRFVNAYGQDWYKQCLSMILSHSARNACRSTFNMLGAHKGADTVCGKD